MSSRLALYRKWRPLTFDDVFGQEHVTDALRTQVASERVSHAYLFTGTRGTGKTTCAKILARAVCCEHPINGNPCNECASCRSILDESALDVSEIDAASNNSVDDVRALRDEVTFSPTALKKRVYIIDEVHMLSTSAFNALLKTLEEPPEHALFILATTELHKVPATILSRCQRYDFRRITPEVIGARLHHIAKSEGYTLDQDACALLSRLADGSMRDGISLLDRSLPEAGHITRAQVTEALGVAPAETIAALVRAILDGDGAQALVVFSDCYLEGRDVLSLFDELLSLLRDLYILRATGKEEYLVSAAAADPALLKDLANRVTSAELEFFVSCVSELLTRLTRTAIRRTDGEMCLLKMALRGSGMLPCTAAVPPIMESRSSLQTRAQHTSATVQHAETTPELDATTPSSTECAPWEEAVTTDERPAPEAVEPGRLVMPSPDSAAQPSQMATPLQHGQAPTSSQLREAFMSMVLSKVSPAVRAHLNAAVLEDKNGTLLIHVNDAVLNILNKQSTLETIQEAAKSLSYHDVRIEKMASEKPSSAIDNLLKNARQLGVQTN